MTQINVKVTAEGLEKLTQMGDSDQVPFAVSLWLNRLANAAQASVREGIKRRFKLHREDFNLRAIYISKANRATKASWSVVIEVQQRADYLNKFEDGGEKVAIGGRRYLAIPNDKVFSDGIVDQGSPLRIKNLNLHKDEHGRLIGDQQTFLLPMRNQAGQAGIFQRTAKDTRKGQARKSKDGQDSGIRLLYKLVARAKIPAKLEFIPTVQATVDAQAGQLMDQAIAEAQRTAK